MRLHSLRASSVMQVSCFADWEGGTGANAHEGDRGIVGADAKRKTKIANYSPSHRDFGYPTYMRGGVCFSRSHTKFSDFGTVSRTILVSRSISTRR
jgi:hypothetical protein